MATEQNTIELAKKVVIQLADKDNWERLAIELVKQGYSVMLDQTKSSLFANKKFYYFKDGGD